MNLLFNIIWFIFGGAELAVLWLALALIFGITIVGLPIARACVEFAKLSAFPFGKRIVRVSDTRRVSGIHKGFNFILNILWFPFGLALTILHIMLGLLYILTIIGIPIGVYYLKLGRLILFPIGARVVEKYDMAKYGPDQPNRYY